MSSSVVEFSKTDALLRVAGLSVNYVTAGGSHVHALREVDLEIAGQESVGILGESGSGKSSLALALLRLLPKNASVTEGKIEYRGHDLLAIGDRGMREIRGAGIALISQEPALALNPVLPVGRQIGDVLRAHQRLSKHEISARIEEMLQEVGFRDPQRIRRAYPHQLSGGQRQRVAIAQALVCRPSLLVADEPLSSLDTVAQAEILELLERLKRELNLAMIFITHNAGVLSALADRVVIMRNGEIADSGTLQEVRRTVDPYVQGLLWPEKILSSTPPRRVTTARDGRLPIIEARNLTKRFVQRRVFSRKKYELTALTNVDLRIEEGSTVALVGRSGSGKSTLARCLAGFETPDSGEVLVQGSRQNLHQHVQLIFQDATTSLNPRFTAAELISEPLQIAGQSTAAERRQRAFELMEEVGLNPDWHIRPAREFSGGQRQRLALARALAASPRLLVMDEALSGLDLPLQAQMVRLLLDLQSRHGLAYLYIAHDLAFVSLFAEKVLVIDEGRIIEQSTPANLWHSRQPATRMLVEAADRVHVPGAEAAP